ncbi:MAG TPA: hypothetical protein VLG69_02925, partial [Candidatus Andersenbacteria bacterium]|nr:hypothetical protein [Candidatus Andersenbacteria bacterium]
HYQSTPSLHEIQDALLHSSYLAEKIEQKFGYIVKRGRLSLVDQRLRRHAIAQDKWKILRRCAPFLAMAPFVRGLGGSGSLAVDNTKFSSDLDILVVVDEGRIWTTRLALLIISQLLGRRRKYDSKHAPDMLCLNHYLSMNRLTVSNDIQNICMAMQYAMLVPIFDDEKMRTFRQRNSRWIDDYVHVPVPPTLQHQYTIHIPRILMFIKKQFELLLREPIGDAIERQAERLQQWIILRHWAKKGGAPEYGRIVLTANELAFHPDTKVPAIVDAFAAAP